MVNNIFFNWLSLGPLKSISELETIAWSHPAAQSPTDDNFTVKTQ